MKIMIVGAGKTGLHLAQRLEPDHDVTIIDQRAEQIELVRGMLPNVLSLQGDACDPALLEYASIEKMDRVVAATGDDEDNLVVAMLAKHFGIGTVYARVNHPNNEWLFDSTWGVDVAVSGPEMLYGLVEKDLRIGDLVTLLDLAREGLAIQEITLPENSSAVGRTLAETRLPSSASVVAVISEQGGAHVARGETMLHAGDQLLLLREDASNPEDVCAALGIKGDAVGDSAGKEAG